MNACSGFETKNPTFGKMHLNNIFTMKMNEIHICIICINNLYYKDAWSYKYCYEIN